jgi:anti-sigma B factor antagonist
MADRTYGQFPRRTDLETSAVRQAAEPPPDGDELRPAASRVSGVNPVASEVDEAEGPQPPIANIQVASDWRPGSVAVVSVSGEVDAYSAGILRRELLGVITAGAQVVVVDLDATTFIDSVTLGVILGAVRRLQNRHGELRVSSANPAIRRTFEITQLDRVLAVYASRDEALADVADT